MSPADCDYIVSCAERCEREMALESTYVLVDDFDSASLCAFKAEVDAWMAFSRLHAGWLLGVDP